MGTRVRSFCKINLGLAVGPVRPDGFHSLTTCYQTVALHDFVSVTAHKAPRTQITLTSDHPGVPCTKRGDCDRNTAYRMVAAALELLEMHAEVHIEIEKRLPVQGGLGAGSANAAAALMGLERELDLRLPTADRLELAAQIGSDVPLFLLGGTVLGLGRGEEVYPLPDVDAVPVVVAIPTVGVSTALAFRELDGMTSHPGTGTLTTTPPADRLKQLSLVLASAWSQVGAKTEMSGITSAVPSSMKRREKVPMGTHHQDFGGGAKGDLAENPLLALVRTGVENDFESVAFRQHPSLRDIKHALEGSQVPGGSGVLYAALSGSGSALFGMYSTRKAADEAQQRVQASGTAAFLTETLSRREYWQRMFA